MHACEKWKLALTLILALTPVCAEAKLFSRAAYPMWDQIALHKIGRLRSPNGEITVVGKLGSRGELAIEIQGRNKSQTFSIGPGVGAEALWSPDSKALVVTGSDGGLGGLFRIHLFYRIPSGGFREFRTDEAFDAAYAKPADCRESPNWAAIKWTMGSRRLLVVAQRVYDLSVCAGHEELVAYIIQIPELKVVRSYTQTEAKRLFGKDMAEFLRTSPHKP